MNKINPERNLLRPRRRAILASVLHVAKLLLRGQSKGQRGEQNRAENEQIQRQRKESKGTSEVRRQRHCVETTITAAPTEPECRPAPLPSQSPYPPRRKHCVQNRTAAERRPQLSHCYYKSYSNKQ